MSQRESDTLWRSPGGGSDYGRLVERINELKRNGCNMLVTGRVSDQQTIKATRRFLGSPETTRRRLAVLIDGASSPADTRFPGEITAADPEASVLDYRGNRHATTATTSSTSPDLAPQTTTPPELTAIREDICSEIQAISTETDLEPSELRVSVETLSGLIDRYPLEEIKPFLRLIAAAVNEFSGMAHYHLPVPNDSRIVDELLSFVDVNIQLRKQRESVPLEHRWHLPEEGKKTEWYKVGD